MRHYTISWELETLVRLISIQAPRPLEAKVLAKSLVM